MADDQPSQDTTPTTAAGPDASTDQRLGELEHHQDTIDQKIDQILGLIRGAGRSSESPAPPAGGGSEGSATADDVAAKVRAELAREAEQQAAADADQADRQSLRERLAKLEERPPAAPVRRATRATGWAGPR